MGVANYLPEFFFLDGMADKKKLKSIEVIVNDDVHKKRLVLLSYDANTYF